MTISEQATQGCCACTLAGPDPACAQGKRLWTRINSAADHASFLRELDSPEGYQIDASDAVIARYQDYEYHVQSQDPTRSQMLATLESLYCIVSGACDLPETVTGVSALGVAWQKSRQERICPGYGERATASNRKLARLITGLAFNATMPYPADHWVTRMQQLLSPLDRVSISKAKALASAYFQRHPEPSER